MDDRYVKSLLLNMCMIYDPDSENVLVLDKRPKVKDGWGGITFPGGHIEPGESVHASVMREVKEETGLEVTNIKYCGMIDWFNEDDNSRFLVFLYKTSSFSGELVEGTEEGKVFWLNKKDLPYQKLAPDFETYLKLFLTDKEEAFGVYGEEKAGELHLCGV